MNVKFINQPTSTQIIQAVHLACRLHGSTAFDGEFETNWLHLPFQHASSHLSALVGGEGTGTARIVFSSGGSTGDPKYTLLRVSEVLKNSAVHGQGYRSCGVLPEDIVATWGMPGLLNSEFTIYLALAQCQCAILPIGDGTSPDKLLQLLKESCANVLLVMPSDLAPLASLLLSRDQRLENVKLIITGGEPLFESDRIRFSRLFGRNVRFRSVYQSSDVGSIGYQCGYCDTGEHHLNVDFQLAELIDFDSAGVGELVLTNLCRELMPVVRRKTGDMVSVRRGACACGSPAPRIRFVRRIGQVVKIGGEKFDLGLLSQIRDRMDVPVDDFHCELYRSNSGNDVFRIFSNRLFLNTRLQTETCEMLIERNDKLRSMVAFNIVAMPQFLAMAGPIPRSSSGKILVFKDSRI